MAGDSPDRKQSGFKRRTPLVAAKSTLRNHVEPHNRSKRVPLVDADGRVLTASITAERNVPHYRRAAVDGYAVQAKDTFGASDRSPTVLQHKAAGTPNEEPQPVDPGTAVRVHTGSEVPGGATAVVMLEDTTVVGNELEVFDAVAAGDNVAPVGEDVEAGTELFDSGHRLRPSDLGLCKSVGVGTVPVYEQPQVAVLPTGEELVSDLESELSPGTIVETNSLTVSRLAERWGGDAHSRTINTDEDPALRAAVKSSLNHDVVVTIGGSSVGERDLVPEVIDDLGEVLVHGVSISPGYPVALGIVEETPVLALPGYPVACIVTAVQFLRPVLSWLQSTTPDPLPTVTATLDRKLPSEPGVRTFARVDVREKEDGTLTAMPTRTKGAGVLSSVALAEGWVVVDEDREGVPEGTEVSVEYWEALI